MNTAQESSLRAVAATAPRKAYWHVAPRFSAGSPALVPLSEAIRIAGHELQSLADCASGVFGDQLKAKASLGLHNVVCARWQAKGKVWRMDLIGERAGCAYQEPARLTWDEKLRFADLANRVQFGITLRPDDQTTLTDLAARDAFHARLCASIKSE